MNELYSMPDKIWADKKIRVTDTGGIFVQEWIDFDPELRDDLDCEFLHPYIRADLNKPLRYTSDLPTVEGWYWFRGLSGDDRRIQEFCYHYVTENPNTDHFGLRRMNGEWAGPKPPSANQPTEQPKGEGEK